MKKVLFLALCAFGLLTAGSTDAKAQQVFKQGDGVLSVGVGLGRSTTAQKLPPISATYEYGVLDGILEAGTLALGAHAELQSFKGVALGDGTQTGGTTLFFVGPRATFHYEFVDRLDTYAGVQAGLYTGGGASDFEADFVLGARYQFNRALGLFGELGTGLSVLRVGVNFNL